MSSPHFRRGTFDDAEDVARVWVTSWHEAYAGLMTPEELDARTIEMRAEHWRSGFDQPGGTRWIGELDGLVVGFAIGSPSQDDDLDPSVTGEVQAIYLLAEAHRRGVGSRLMERVLRDLSAQGLGDAALWVLEANANAIAFYERGGWQPDGGRKDCFGGADAPAIRYRKPLI